MPFGTPRSIAKGQEFNCAYCREAFKAKPRQVHLFLPGLDGDNLLLFSRLRSDYRVVEGAGAVGAFPAGLLGWTGSERGVVVPEPVVAGGELFVATRVPSLPLFYDLVGALLQDQRHDGFT